MITRTLFRSLIGTGLLYCCAQPSYSATFNIGNNDVAALKSAINTANVNNEYDVINLAAGGDYYFATADNATDGGNALPVIGNDLFLPGQDLTIHGNGATIERSTFDGTPAFRFFELIDGASVTIDNLVISNGLQNPAVGGAILNNHGRLTLRNCTLFGNLAPAAGAVASKGDGTNGLATLTVTDCTFSRNNGGNAGGGIFNDGSSNGNAILTVDNCVFDHNSAIVGGGILNYHLNGGNAAATVQNSSFTVNLYGSGSAIGNEYGTLTLTNCTVENNDGIAVFNYGFGGSTASLTIINSTLNFNAGTAILNEIGGILMVTNCAVIANSSGGGLYNHGAAATLADCSVSFNSGGGIVNDGRNGAASLTIINSAISGNYSGSGIHNDGSSGSASLALKNCTISANSASDGGGIFNDGQDGGSATVTLANCTLSGNSATIAGGIFNGGFAGTASLTLRNTILKTGPSGSNLVNDNGDVVSQGHNLSNDAAGGGPGTNPAGFLNATGDKRNTDPQLGPLADNGGSTQTHALLAASPAINAGDDANAPHRDQRGYFRNGKSDIGAFEYQGGLIGSISISRIDPDVVVGAEVVRGKTYRLERKLNLSDATWQSIPGVQDFVATGNDIESITDPGALNLGKAFYRVMFVQ